MRYVGGRSVVDRERSGARWGLAIFALVFAAALLQIAFAAKARAQESEILRAIGEGEIGGGSQLALPPPPGNEAAALPGADRSERFLARISREQERDIVDRAYPLLAAKWPFNVIYVCWEAPSPDDVEKRDIVRKAVEETWETNSGLWFRGWNTCSDSSVGIRIAVADTGPHVKLLGKYVDGVKDGMVLNFTFQTWSPSCREKLDYCIRTIAVHEFGHAIGFAHEQNRPDTPGECFQPPQGTEGDTVTLTPWDPHSVMNYCNPAYNNDGVLSDFDIVAVQYIYGAP